MSIDIDWHRLTTGAEGTDLANSIREFIHDKFQQVELPRFIRSVQVHTFNFGDVCPHVEIKDFGDPWEEFYEDEEGGSSSDGADEAPAMPKQQRLDIAERPASRSVEKDLDPFKKPPRPLAAGLDNSATRPSQRSSKLNDINPAPLLTHRARSTLTQPPESPFLSGSNTPGIPGGTSNLSYFHLPLSTGLRSGTQTPLAAAFGPGSLDHHRPTSPLHATQHWDISSQLSSSSSPPHHQRKSTAEGDHTSGHIPNHDGEEEQDRSMDLQTTLHMTYDGPLSLSLTAEILLDYPMQSFVGIPLSLRITGLSFDGVALLAYIKTGGAKGRKEKAGSDDKVKDGIEQSEEGERGRCHFCFLGPEDAKVIIGDGGTTAFEGNKEPSDEEGKGGKLKDKDLGGLLREIRVETEIGRQEDGKQGLKNVGKVEKFVLEQVRRIFDEEFVWPSFWTFLV